jgi:hypothetical protein
VFFTFNSRVAYDLEGLGAGAGQFSKPKLINSDTMYHSKALLKILHHPLDYYTSIASIEKDRDSYHYETTQTHHHYLP